MLSAKMTSTKMLNIIIIDIKIIQCLKKSFELYLLKGLSQLQAIRNLKVFSSRLEFSKQSIPQSKCYRLASIHQIVGVTNLLLKPTTKALSLLKPIIRAHYQRILSKKPPPPPRPPELVPRILWIHPWQLARFREQIITLP